jgi:hypothetical protein
MPNNVFEMDTLRQLSHLVSLLGSLEACKRLGFVFEDERKVMSLSHAGLGYLLFVEAASVTELAEAFAAGYQCACELK